MTKPASDANLSSIMKSISNWEVIGRSCKAECLGGNMVVSVHVPSSMDRNYIYMVMDSTLPLLTVVKIWESLSAIPNKTCLQCSKAVKTQAENYKKDKGKHKPSICSI